MSRNSDLSEKDEEILRIFGFGPGDNCSVKLDKRTNEDWMREFKFSVESIELVKSELDESSSSDSDDDFVINAETSEAIDIKLEEMLVLMNPLRLKFPKPMTTLVKSRRSIPSSGARISIQNILEKTPLSLQDFSATKYSQHVHVNSFVDIIRKFKI